MLQSIFLSSLLIITISFLSVEGYSARQEQVEIIAALKMLSNDVRRFSIENCSTASSYTTAEALADGVIDRDYADNIFSWGISMARPGRPVIIVLETDKTIHQQILSVFPGERFMAWVAVSVPQTSHMMTPDLYPNISAETLDQSSGCL